MTLALHKNKKMVPRKSYNFSNLELENSDLLYPGWHLIQITFKNGK